MAIAVNRTNRRFLRRQVVAVSGHLSVQRKQKLCEIMSLNLPTLRTKANLSQNELAERIGLSRQTISALEGCKREMQWSTFSTLALFLSKDKEVSKLMSVMGILDEDVRCTLNI